MEIFRFLDGGAVGLGKVQSPKGSRESSRAGTQEQEEETADCGPRDVRVIYF